jgi:hypothetical protein
MYSISKATSEQVPCVLQYFYKMMLIRTVKTIILFQQHIFRYFKFHPCVAGTSIFVCFVL